jgi:hypothetical protein
MINKLGKKKILKSHIDSPAWPIVRIWIVLTIWSNYYGELLGGDHMLWTRKFHIRSNDSAYSFQNENSMESHSMK